MLVVELLSPPRSPGPSSTSTSPNGVKEVLEINVATGRARLLARPDSTTDPADTWAEAGASHVIPGLVIVDGTVEVNGEHYP